MKNARTLLVLLALLGLFLAGWWLGRRSVGSSIVEHTRIDTVFFERPQSVTHSRQLVSVNIPKLLFAPADTVLKTVIAPDGTDSVPVRLPFERREGSRDGKTSDGWPYPQPSDTTRTTELPSARRR